jgi:transcriptional regulator of acetoin/glycerol metabolism
VAHERFVTTSGAPPEARDLVAESWRRCTAHGVRPDGSRLPPLRATSAELAAYRRTHPLAVALPLFRELPGAGAADDGHVFAVADTDGTLLWVAGLQRAGLHQVAEFLDDVRLRRDRVGRDHFGPAVRDGLGDRA